MQQHEENMQIMLFQWADLHKKKYPALVWMHHIPNGGQRSKATAGRLKAAGVKSGIPDVFLPYPCGKYAGLYIELKHGKNKPTQNQTVCMEYLKSVGYCVKLCYSFKEAMEVILSYLGAK